MHPNAELLKRFYDAFARKDGQAMADCYAPDATFTDAVFQGLEGPEVGGMWKMLCERGADLVIVSSGIEADDSRGKAHWEADYTFSTTGRKVHNVVDGAFRFANGKIVEHVDTFPFYAWTRQALGPVGVLLGWTPLVQGQVRKQARQQLTRYLARPA